MINKAGASDRGSVLLINADREYHEGKNQNSLRPEDIEKITHVYHNRLCRYWCDTTAQPFGATR
ncbi:MAG: N-6 DNA methylase [Pirellulaceae bacterium]